MSLGVMQDVMSHLWSHRCTRLLFCELHSVKLSAMEKAWKERNAQRIDKDVALSSMRDRRHSAHCMFYSQSSHLLFGRIPMRFSILMGVRFDGNFGFPGGFVEINTLNETIESRLNRELLEEINLDKKLMISERDYLSSYVQTIHEGKYVNHFYLKEVSEAEFSEMEKASFSALEWGKETLGIARVPVQKGVGFARTHLPIVDFLQNKFIGNARQELVEGMLHAGIFTEDEMEAFWEQLPQNQR